MRSSKVDDYVAALPAGRREEFERFRSLVHEALPDTREDIQYKMPAFYTDDLVCTIAAQKAYFSLYICKPSLLDKHREALAGLNLGKGCIRFKNLDAVPLEAMKAVLIDAASDPGWNH